MLLMMMMLVSDTDADDGQRADFAPCSLQPSIILQVCHELGTDTNKYTQGCHGY